jgi:hypothetical protein
MKRQDANRRTGRTSEMVMKLPFDGTKFYIVCLNYFEINNIRNIVVNVRADLHLKIDNFIVFQPHIGQKLQGLRKSQVFIDHAVFDHVPSTNQMLRAQEELREVYNKLRD